MQLFPWDDGYAIGNAEIDRQHRRLVDMINELSDAMIAHKGQKAVPQILEKLVDYIQLHFATEEDVMRDGGYPALDEHCREHREMTDEVLEFRNSYAENQQVSPSELLGFLCEWLKNHILMSDRELGSFLASRAQP